MTNMANFFATKIVNPETCVPFNSLITLQSNGVLVYPNPVNDVLNITSEDLIQSVRILTLSGTVVKTFNVNQSTFQTKVPELSSGVYMLEITLENLGVQTTIIRK